MIFGLMSDTHGSVSAWNRTIALFKEANCEYIIHIGDVLYHGPRNPLPDDYAPKELAEYIVKSELPTHIVRGNCDADIDAMILGLPTLPKVIFEAIEGWKFLVIHGEEFNNKPELGAFGKTFGADVVLFGHIHIPVFDLQKNGIYVINPGSCALPKGKGIPSAAVTQVEKGSIQVHFLDIRDGKEFRTETIKK
ncbi:MAG: phosphodiesterase [Thermotogae bacterium]|nr:phosphodiesterase [Thermotogota bacterium]